jgi:hypothetical protein
MLCDHLTTSEWTALYHFGDNLIDRYQNITLNKDTISGPYSMHWRAQEHKQIVSKITYRIEAIL